jgi:hypothetical protein
MREYCKATVTWKPKVNSGYGTTYGTAVSVDEVYFERSIKLNRGQDNTSSSDAFMVRFTNTAFMIGDKITYDGRDYTIMSVNEFYKPRTVIFDHIECELKEVQNV